MRLYRFNVKPEIVRFVAISVLTYLVEVARRYSTGEFDRVTEWGPVIVALLVGLIQFAGARLLAFVGDTPTPPSPATAPPREYRAP